MAWQTPAGRFIVRHFHEGYRADEASFDEVWCRLASRHQCDELGSCEYQRVEAEWFLMGRPRPIRRFIRRAANRPST